MADASKIRSSGDSIITTIPPAVRDKMDLKKGDVIIWSDYDDHYRVVKYHE